MFPRNDQLSDGVDATDRAPDLSLHLPSARRPPRRDLAGRSRRSRKRRCSFPAIRPRSSSAGSVHSASRTSFAPSTVKRLALGPNLRIAIHIETSITDGPGGDSASRRQRRHGAARQPERLPHRRPRRLAGARTGRPPLAAVQRRDLVPDGLRRTAAAHARARRRQGRQSVRQGDALRRGGRRSGRRAERRPARVPRPGAVPPQRDRRRRAEHLPRPAQLHDAARRRPGTAVCWRSPARRSMSRPSRIPVTHPIADDEVDAIFDHKAEYLREYQADWMPWLAEMHQPLESTEHRSAWRR